MAELHIRMPNKLKEQIKKEAKECGMSSMGSYLLHFYFMYKEGKNPIFIPETSHVPKISHSNTISKKKIPIERIKQTKVAKSHIPQHIDEELRNTIKNLFKTKTVKDILKTDGG